MELLDKPAVCRLFGGTSPSDKLGGSPLHPFDRSVHVYELHQSAVRPPSRSDTPLLCKQSWAVWLVVFDLRLLGRCRSSSISLGLFGIWERECSIIRRNANTRLA
jgi:hypothetical protein